MADLAVWYALALAGAIMVAAGLAAIGLSRRTSAAEHAGWEEHLDELDELAEAPTKVMPAVPYQGGRHSYPGRPAANRGYQPRHDEDSIGWRLVPEGWAPPIGAARIAAEMDATQVQPPVVEP